MFKCVFAIAVFFSLSFAQTSFSQPERPRITPKQSWNKLTIPEREMPPLGEVREIVIHHTGYPDPSPEAVKAYGTVERQIRARQNWTNAERIRSHQIGHFRIKRAWPPGQGAAWGDLAYHYYIAPNAEIVEGRSTRHLGASNTHYDLRGKIQVVLEGNFNIQELNEGQKKSLVELVAWLASEHNVKVENIKAHRDQQHLGNKPGLISSCPGQNLYDFLPELRRRVAAQLN